MSTHLACLNPAQRAAATTPAPLLVLAGAGSGKTETLIRRVADLILGGEPPDRLLCITFTAKAAGEMRGRLAALLGPEQTPRWVGTFHAVMARLLTEDGCMTVNLFGRSSSYERSLEKIAGAFGEKALWAFRPTREGNTIVLAQRSPSRPKRPALAERAQSIQTRWSLPAPKWLRVFKPLGPVDT